MNLVVAEGGGLYVAELERASGLWRYVAKDEVRAG